MSFNITSLNVKGLNSPQKRQMTWKEASRLKSDIICLQETHFAADKPPAFSNRKFPQVFTANGPKKKGGVAIAIRDTVPFSEITTHLDNSGRFIVLVCEIFTVKYTLINVYLPNTNQLRFLKKIWKKVDSMKQGHVILCGDFNAIPNKELDCTNPKRLNYRRTTLAEFIATSGLFNVWRCQHSSEKDYFLF